MSIEKFRQKPEDIYTYEEFVKDYEAGIIPQYNPKTNAVIAGTKCAVISWSGSGESAPRKEIVIREARLDFLDEKIKEALGELKESKVRGISVTKTYLPSKYVFYNHLKEQYIDRYNREKVKEKPMAYLDK